VIARGIEDMQIQYRQADGTLTSAAPGAPAVVASAYNTLTTEVIVTLSARSMLRGRIQGQMDDASGGTALRGSLTSSGAPRSALVALTAQAMPSPSPGASPTYPLWQ